MTTYQKNKEYAKAYLAGKDDIKVRVDKGKKAVYKAVADERGKSLNQYIIDLIEADMKGVEDEDK